MPEEDTSSPVGCSEKGHNSGREDMEAHGLPYCRTDMLLFKHAHIGKGRMRECSIKKEPKSCDNCATHLSSDLWRVGVMAGALASPLPLRLRAEEVRRCPNS